MVHGQAKEGQNLAVTVLFVPNLLNSGRVEGERFRGGLVFEARRLCVSLNSRLASNKEEEEGYRGTSLIRKRIPLGPYSRTMPRALWGS